MAGPSDAVAETVKRWYDAYDRRDVDELCALAAPDIEIAPAGPRAGHQRGRSFHGVGGVRSLMELSARHWPHSRLAGLVVRPLAPWTLARATYTTNEPGSRQRIWGDAHALFLVEDGRVRRLLSFVLESEQLPVNGFGVLTARERDVLHLLSRGLNAPQISAELYVSPATVRTHVRNAMVRLGARTRVEAVALALKHGEIPH